MTNKKNKFFTFCFSIIPGAGEMYLGFYKMGISLMVLFCLCISIAGLFNIPTTMLLAPVICFYSFFHVHNLNALPDEEFYALEDDWLIHIDRDTFVFEDWLKKYRRLVAGVMILFGISILWSNITDIIYRFIRLLNLPDSLLRFLNPVTQAIPQMIVALFIIFLGMKLLKIKKHDLREEDDMVIPAPPYIEVKTVERGDDKD